MKPDRVNNGTTMLMENMKDQTIEQMIESLAKMADENVRLAQSIQQKVEDLNSGRYRADRRDGSDGGSGSSS